MSAIEERSERFAELIDPGAELEVLGEGFAFLEGPVWNPQQSFLLFSDLGHDVRRRWDAGDGISVVAEETNHGADDGTLSGGEIFVVEGEEGQTQDGFLTWGGDDLRSLFICASRRLLRLRTHTRANPVPHLRTLAR